MYGFEGTDFWPGALEAAGEAAALAPAATKEVKRAVGEVRDKVVSSARALSERTMQVCPQGSPE